MTPIELCITAGVGGLAPNIIDLWDDSKKAPAERLTKGATYWLFWLIWPMVGASLATIYRLDGAQFTYFLAFSIGVSGPTTLKTLLATGARPSAAPAGAEN
jgi:hypothetical protein